MAPSGASDPDWVIVDTVDTVWDVGPNTVTKLGQFREAPDGEEERSFLLQSQQLH